MRNGLFKICMLVLVTHSIAKAQRTLLDDNFHGTLSGDRWAVVGPGQMKRGGKLVILPSDNPAGASEASGIVSKAEGYPVFERPKDDSEYNVYFFGIHASPKLKELAVGLYSAGRGEQPTANEGPEKLLSYRFMLRPDSQRRWIWSATSREAAAATDSTGGNGFHIWRAERVYDLRIEVTRHDVTWWGRFAPNLNWQLLQDPGMTMGYDGHEPGGQSSFGIAFWCIPGKAWNEKNSPLASVDHIVVTHYVPRLVKTILYSDFQSGQLDNEIWRTVTSDSGDRIEIASGKPLRIINREGGAEWQHADGIWTRPDRFPLFKRPIKPGERVYVDFLGVELPSMHQRCVLGLYSTPIPAGPLKFPGGLDPNGSLAYGFWVLPDNDRLVENSNQLRAIALGQKYVADDNTHHEWIWSFTEKRDLRIEVTSEDVEWFMRLYADSAWRVLRDNTEFMYRRPVVPEDRATGYWFPLYDPGVLNSRTYGRNDAENRDQFGVFIHVSAAGQNGGVHWKDGDLSLDAIRVSVVDGAK